MLELEDAVARVLAAVPSPESERIPLAEAQGRVNLGRVLSPVDLPLFDNSAMDGYAVRAEDIAAAMAQAPVRLRVLGRAAAGQVFGGDVGAGTCVRVFTGSALPRGADAVVMQEDTRSEEGTEPSQVWVLSAAKPWENVRLKGEDIKRGATLVEAGEQFSAGRVGLLAAAAMAEVSAGRRPVVGLLATGSELREPGQPLRSGQIYESNRIGLSGLVRSAGGLPRLLPLVPDDLEATREALLEAFEQCDVVVTSGGVSVGDMDFVKSAFEQAGGTLHFWRVAMKPGRPFVFGARRGKLLFGLPGNPVSAAVTFLLLVRPALFRWQGAKEVGLPTHPGVLAEALSNPGERRHFMRVRVDGEGRVYSAGLQASHALASLASANGLLDMAPGASLAKGAPVRVMRIDGHG